MACNLLFLSLIFSQAATAGEVVLTTDTSVVVNRDGVTIARAAGPGQLSLGEFPPGKSMLQFVRTQARPVEAEINVPISGVLNLSLDGDTLNTQLGSQALTNGTPPIVVFRPQGDQKFSVVVNDTKRVAVNSEKALEDLGAGIHRLEVRSADNLTIWAKGSLSLQPGDTIVLDLEAGRTVTALGHEKAWKREDSDPVQGP